ncbi:MAG: BON domain-containing protein [Oceanicaulis sp.]
MTPPATPRPLRFACLTAALAVSLSACAAVEPGRSMGRQLDDFNASLQVKSAMLRSEGYRLDQVDVEITEGVMLLTGSAPRASDRTYAECLAWSSPSVRSVVNEIEVGEWRTARELASDQLITQRVRARLVQDSEIRSTNFNIETREAVVYLLGYARSRAEADRAADLAARASGVEKVVDLVRVSGDAPELPARGALRAEACDAAGGGPVQPAREPALEPFSEPAREPLPSPETLDAPPLAGPAAQPEDTPRPFEPRVDRTRPSEPRRTSPDAPPF